VHRPGGLQRVLPGRRQDHRRLQADRRPGGPPGYGFLSENAEFSRRLEEEGIKFIGPKHYSIAKMGDKIESKKLAIEAGNTIPGYNDAIDGPDAAVEIAKKIGYPVMIKASAGGGGKGLRVAYNDAEAHEGFSSCVNEARNSFGDDRVFIESTCSSRATSRSRCWATPTATTCISTSATARSSAVTRRSSRRRRAPSSTRDAQGDGRAGRGPGPCGQLRIGGHRRVRRLRATKEFYFLEMNTRLQVEHPVTELITGLDLVEQMIRVAYGEKLPLAQADVQINGWAMECRINAEDPFRGFLPSTGRLVKFQPPAEIPQVRVDTGVYDGGEISMFYDSMIAKLIVHGATRAGHRPHARRPQRLRDPRHLVEHSVPGRADAAPGLPFRHLRHRLHPQALPDGLRCLDGAPR
jgi:propionyl-CoA carboxylase alpha chain